MVFSRVSCLAGIEYLDYFWLYFCWWRQSKFSFAIASSESHFSALFWAQHNEWGSKNWTRTIFFKRHSSVTVIATVKKKLQLPGYQINAQFSCGTSHSIVSRAYVSAGEALNCILLGYLELRPATLLLNEFFCVYSTFTHQQKSP